MDQQTVKSYASYLLDYRSLDHEIVSLLNNFPFTRWNMLFWIAKKRNQKLDDWVDKLNEELTTFRRLRYIARNIRHKSVSYDVLTHFYTKKWAKFNDAFLQALAYDSYLFTGEIAREVNARKEKRVRICLLSAISRLCFLSTFLVFRPKLVQRVQDIRSDIRLGMYDDAYKKEVEFEGKMKFVYLRAIIERGFVAAIPTVISLVAFENPVGAMVGLAFLVATVTILPYYMLKEIFG